MGAYGIIFVLFISSNPSEFPLHVISIDSVSYCVGTRRRAILDRQQINICRQILVSDHATNFETRMVAEVNLYWIIYESCSTAQVDLPQTQALLHEWNQEWKFLFGNLLPRSTFLSSHYARSATISISSDGLPLCSATCIRQSFEIQISGSQRITNHGDDTTLCSNNATRSRYSRCSNSTSQ